MFMRHTSLQHLLRQQTHLIQALGLYLSDAAYVPSTRDYVLLSDIAHRAEDAHTLCRHLEIEFWNRSRSTDV